MVLDIKLVYIMCNFLFEVMQSSEPEENGSKKEGSGDSDVKLVTGGESSSQSKREYMNFPWLLR